MPESPRPCQYPREQFLTTNDGKPTTSRDNLVPRVTVLSHNELISFSLHLPWLHFIRCTSLHSHGIVLHSIKNVKTYPVGQPFRDLKTVAAHALKPLLKCLLHIRTCRFLPWNMQTMEYGFSNFSILGVSLKYIFNCF